MPGVETGMTSPPSPAIRHDTFVEPLSATIEVINEIAEIQVSLHQLKMFSTEPQYALMTAAQFVLHDLIEHEKLNDFKESILFIQALDMSSFLSDINLLLALEILDLFI